MTSFVATLKSLLHGRGGQSSGERAFDYAMRISDELVHHFSRASKEPDVIRDLFSDMFEHRHNTPYATSVYEAHQEMIGPAKHGKQAGREEADNVRPLRAIK